MSEGAHQQQGSGGPAPDNHGSFPIASANAGYNPGANPANQQGQDFWHRNGSGPFGFPVGVCIGAMRALKLPRQLRISTCLPHIFLVIGTEGATVYLEVMGDTGAGLNLGLFDYHKDVAGRHPHLVESFVIFEGTEYDELAVGGVGGADYGTDVMATITYRMPYVIKGRPATITFGLARKAICKSLVGIPFFIGSKMSYSISEGIMSSAVFGVSFPVQMKEISAETSAPSFVKGNETGVL